MTAPAPKYTHSECADVRVRPPGTRRVVPIRPDIGDPSARPHAIPRSPNQVNNNEPGKIRNFVSQHAGEARTATAGSWLAHYQPPPLADTARALTANPGTWLRLTVHTLTYLACVAVDTNKRAAVAAGLLLLSLLTAWAATAWR